MDITTRQAIYFGEVKAKFRGIIEPKLWEVAIPQIMEWIFYTTMHSDSATPYHVRIAYNKIAKNGYRPEDFDI